MTYYCADNHESPTQKNVYRTVTKRYKKKDKSLIRNFCPFDILAKVLSA